MATCEVTEKKEYLLRLSEEEARMVQALCDNVEDRENTASKYASSVYLSLLSVLGNNGHNRSNSLYHMNTPVRFTNPLPAPELEPLMMKDIKPGEWFTTHLDDDEGMHYVHLRTATGLVTFTKTSPAHFPTIGNNTVRRLTLDEARELAKAKGYLFPF